MKHLKIAFAIVFFCLIGGINSELKAQETMVYLQRLYLGTSISSPNKNFLFQVRNNKIILFDMRRGEINNWHRVWEKEYSSDIEYLIVEQGSLLVKEKNKTPEILGGNEKRGGKGTFLRLEDNGNLALYNGTWYGGDGDLLWATGTCGAVLDGCGSVGDR